MHLARRRGRKSAGNSRKITVVLHRIRVYRAEWSKEHLGHRIMDSARASYTY